MKLNDKNDKVHCIKNYYYEGNLLFENNKNYNFRYEEVSQYMQSYPRTDHTTKIWIEYYQHTTNKKMEHSFFIRENQFVHRNFDDYFLTQKESRKQKLLQLKNVSTK